MNLETLTHLIHLLDHAADRARQLHYQLATHDQSTPEDNETVEWGLKSTIYQLAHTLNNQPPVQPCNHREPRTAQP